MVVFSDMLFVIPVEAFGYRDKRLRTTDLHGQTPWGDCSPSFEQKQHNKVVGNMSTDGNAKSAKKVQTSEVYAGREIKGKAGPIEGHGFRSEVKMIGSK